jgi:hypothetical protein
MENAHFDRLLFLYRSEDQNVYDFYYGDTSNFVSLSRHLWREHLEVGGGVTKRPKAGTELTGAPGTVSAPAGPATPAPPPSTATTHGCWVGADFGGLFYVANGPIFRAPMQNFTIFAHGLISSSFGGIGPAPYNGPPIDLITDADWSIGLSAADIQVQAAIGAITWGKALETPEPGTDLFVTAAGRRSRCVYHR